jgi:Domain of unknown function (DUF4249)
MKKIALLILLSSLILACNEQTVILDLSQVPSKVVIDGLVTNVAGKQYVMVSRSASFYQSGKTQRITNATVRVEDNLGNVFTFAHNPTNKPDSVGRYSGGRFKGVIGRRYKLSVTVDGQTYTAEDNLVSVTTIDKAIPGIDDEQKKDPKVAGQFYKLLISLKEPQETIDYYLFKFYRNGVRHQFSPSDVFVSSDDGLAATVTDLGLNVFFAEGDKAKAEVYSLSRGAYLYYSDLRNLLTSDGGLFSSPPANPRTNISNGGLGVFQVSALNSSTEVLVK